jgi:CubicO group peptidase (beta-lactamase class C family)
MLYMQSGVAWNEDYLNPSSDRNQITNCYVNRVPNCIVPYMASLPRAIDPNTGQPAVQGAVWNYSTGEGYLVGLAVQRATGESLAEFVEETVWKPYGMEHDGLWLRESNDGPDFGAAGFNATLRDYARFGKFVRDNGFVRNGPFGFTAEPRGEDRGGGYDALPAHWVRDAITWTASSAAPGYADNGQYGYFWWFNPAYDDGINMPLPLATKTSAPLQNSTASTVIPITGTTADWTFMALGIYGQMIAINQLENLVIVQWATWDLPDPTDVTVTPSDPYNEEAALANALCDALHD